MSRQYFMQSAVTGLARIRQTTPLVHCITNAVTINDVANALLAIGASPVMAQDAREVQEIAANADALVLNLGMLSPERLGAMRLAGIAANVQEVPVILDPVGVGASRFRAESVATLLEEVHFTAIRCNASEARCLAGFADGAAGVDAETDIDPTMEGNAAKAADLAAHIAVKYDTVVAVTGKIDVVSDGVLTVQIHNGTEKLREITGAGCMTSGLVGAACACLGDALVAVTLGVASMGIAGEIALKNGGKRGHGSFHIALLDAISQLDEEALTGSLDLEVEHVN